MTIESHGHATERTRSVARKLDAVGWGLFFTWTGIALLAAVGWGVGLLGVGLIMLGVQAARRYFRLTVEGFALFVGLLFAVGGVWELLGTRVRGAAVPGGLVPILCIVAGIMLLVSAVRGRPPDRTAA